MKAGKKRIGYLIPTGLGAIAALLIALSRSIGSVETAAERYTILCDAFTIPGVVLLLLGVVMILTAQGAFDGFKRGMRRESDAGEGAEKKSTGWKYVMIPGGVYLIIAIVFWMILKNGG